MIGWTRKKTTTTAPRKICALSCSGRTVSDNGCKDEQLEDPHPIEDLAHADSCRKAGNHERNTENLACDMDGDAEFGRRHSEENGAQGEDHDKGDAHADSMRCCECGHKM